MIEECKIKIENKINEILDKEIKKYEDNEFIKESLEELKRLSKGGKRVRGYLVKLGAMLFGKDDDSYIDLAAALFSSPPIRFKKPCPVWKSDLTTKSSTAADVDFIAFT